MTEFNEDLEIGLAAGLSVPEALALSAESDNKEPENKRSGCLGVILLFIIALFWLI